MAQTIFEALTVGGVPCTVDNQTAIAVQSLIDSQNVQNNVDNQDDDDIFQCGKCKKQFTSLTLFVSHKQVHCNTLVSTAPSIRVEDDGVCLEQAVANSYTTTLPTACTTVSIPQSIAAYATATGLSSSPIATHQLTQGVVLNDELISFTSLDPNLQQQALQLVNAPFTRQTGGNVSILNSGTTISTFTTNGSGFANTVTNQVQTTPVPDQVTITPEKTIDGKPGLVKTDRSNTQFNVITVLHREEALPAIIPKPNKPASGKQVKRMLVDVAVRQSERTVVDAVTKKKLHCQYCDKKFAKNFDLQQHVRAHTGEKPFQCIVCGRAFAQKSNVKKHMATHKVWPSETMATLPKQIAAVYVMQKEAPEIYVESEIVQTTDKDKIDEVEEDPDNPEKQMKVVIDNSYVCQYCPNKFMTYFQLKTHMIQHKEQQVYKCVMKNCLSTFLDLDSFLEHTKTHENEMSYRCHMCNKYFASLYELGVHQYTHSLYPNQGPKPGPRHFQCTKCMNKYSTPEALEHHMASTSHQYDCPHCDKMFTCERYLRRHLPTHGTEGQFECGHCHKRFKAEAYLRNHLLTHSGEKPFICEICSARFNRKDRLKRHQLIHSSTWKYKCPFKSLMGCLKEFNRPDKLKAHIITHSGIKPFKCKECGKTFSRKPHLAEHERGHRADFKHRCDKCGKGYFRSRLYNEHKCNPQKDGLDIQVFRPRNRRKVGPPKKRMITVTQDDVRDPRTTRGRSKRRTAANQQATQLVIDGLDVEQIKATSLPITVGEADMTSHALTLTSTKSDVKVETLLDHYVVHLTEPVHDRGQTIQTFIPTVSGGQVIHTGEPGSLQPITILEAQPVHMTVTNSDGTTDLSLLTSVTQADVDSMVGTQVVVTDVACGEHTLITCPAQLVDYTSI